ncbi:MAG: nucleoside recognition domain-containing protein [Ruminiclostridium sp.]|nr:nucleoside recognition domain-containing protein [Ruminiclostridium sp.]
MILIMNWFSKFAIPGLIAIILILGAFRNIPVFDAFIEGAKEGLTTTVKILPVIIGILLGINILKESGALDMIVLLLSPIADFFGFPKEILPMALLRPVSGSASLGLLNQQLKEYGPDSYIGKTISVMMGSTETIFYTIAVYFGAIGVKETKHTLWIALIAGLAGLISAIIICRIIP